jgi:crotonobetainyl-CoA:carnitine CoA-transferase CaiB-like acyl-CoA transferase
MKPLAGVTVLEFSTMITASFAAMMMAEQGASVIKVEPIEMGDPMRYIGASKAGMSALFANCNRGKESIRVNLKDAAGQALIRRLIPDVDIVIHNFRPGVMDKLNLGSEQLRAINPRLIYMAISGFGHQGPLGSAPAYDPIIQAHAGMTAAQGLGTPVFIRNLVCDKITAYTACQAVTSALYLREKTGDGQHIDLSMLDSGLFFLFPDAFMNHTLLDDDIDPQPLLSDLIYELTLTADGGLTFSAGVEKQRNGMLRAVGLEALIEDPRFQTPEGIAANRDIYIALVRDAFLGLTTDDALQKLQAHDVPCAKCLSLDEVLSQEQLVANESLATFDHPSMGAMRMMKAAPRFGGEVLTPGGPSPTHGEHTDAVLARLKLTAADIQNYKAKGVVA